MDVELRLDPLFPSTSIAPETRNHRPLPDYGLPEAQGNEDIENLVHFAAQAGAKAVVAKTLKVPVSDRAKTCKHYFRALFTDAGRGRPTVRGGSWRLPDRYIHELVSRVAKACVRHGVQFRKCKDDLLDRR